jgi:hypothetical protein
MRAAISILMSSLLLAQAVFGLCWHEVDDCAHCPSRPAACANQCCDAPPTEPSSKQPTESPRGHLECRGCCTFLPTQSFQVDSQHHIAVDFLADTATVLDGGLATPPSWTLLRASRNHAPPLRLYLLHQLLLI